MKKLNKLKIGSRGVHPRERASKSVTIRLQDYPTTGATATRLTGATALRATGATASRTTGATESTVSGATASRTTSVTLTASNGQAGFGITAGTTQDAGNNIVLTYWDVEVYDLYETVDVVEEYEVEESYEVEEQYNVTATMPAVAASTKAGTATATRIKQ